MTEGRNFIAGEWVPAAATSPDVNPSNTNDVVGHYPQARAEDVQRAIAAAQEAFPAWSRSTPQLRHDALKRIGDELLALIRVAVAGLHSDEGVPVALGGRLLDEGPLLGRLFEAIDASIPDAEPRRADGTPLDGALLLGAGADPGAYASLVHVWRPAA